MILSNDIKWMCKGKKCFSGEMKCLGRSLVLVLFFGCFAGTVGSLAPTIGSGSGQDAVAAGTSCNLPKELAFAMPVGCGLRLKGMDNCQMPDVSCKPPVYFWCTQCCSLCLRCIGRKPSFYLEPLRTQIYLVHAWGWCVKIGYALWPSRWPHV